jgi:uncharacterized DUF497 family protein
MPDLRISGIVWLEEVVDKLQRKHGVLSEEVEEVLASRCRMRRIEAGNLQGEDLYAALGRTEAGRYLTVFFVFKSTQQALIVSAREMTRSERARYAKK